MAFAHDKTRKSHRQIECLQSNDVCGNSVDSKLIAPWFFFIFHSPKNFDVGRIRFIFYIFITINNVIKKRLIFGISFKSLITLTRNKQQQPNSRPYSRYFMLSFPPCTTKLCNISFSKLAALKYNLLKIMTCGMHLQSVFTLNVNRLCGKCVYGFVKQENVP